MDLSVIICTWNNAKRLAITLDSLLDCYIPKGLKWEVVIVNNNCTDDTDLIVQDYIKKLPIKYVQESILGLSRARNKGLSVANGELILFTDDDVKVSREWIYYYWITFVEKPVGFYFGGPVISEYELPSINPELLRASPPSIRGLNWGKESRVLKNNEFFIAANWACLKKYLKMVGGFDVNRGLNSFGKFQSGEESDLMKRLDAMRLRPWYISNAIVIHFVPKNKCTLRYIVTRKEAIALAFAREIRRDNKCATIWSIPRWIFRELIVSAVRVLLGIFKGEKRYIDYVNLRFLIKTITGILWHEE